MTTEELARLENNHRIWLSNPTTKEIIKVLENFEQEAHAAACLNAVDLKLTDAQVRIRMIGVQYASVFIAMITDFKVLSTQLNKQQP